MSDEPIKGQFVDLFHKPLAELSQDDRDDMLDLVNGQPPGATKRARWAREKIDQLTTTVDKLVSRPPEILTTEEAADFLRISGARTAPVQGASGDGQGNSKATLPTRGSSGMGRRAGRARIFLRGGTYWCRFTAGGKQVFKSTGTGDSLQAERTAEKIYAETLLEIHPVVAERRPTAAQAGNLDQQAARYLVWAATQGRDSDRELKDDEVRHHAMALGHSCNCSDALEIARLKKLLAAVQPATARSAMFEGPLVVLDTLLQEIGSHAKNAPYDYSRVKFMLRRAEAKLLEAVGFLEAAEANYGWEKAANERAAEKKVVAAKAKPGKGRRGREVSK